MNIWQHLGTSDFLKRMDRASLMRTTTVTILQRGHFAAIEQQRRNSNTGFRQDIFGAVQVGILGN